MGFQRGCKAFNVELPDWLNIATQKIKTQKEPNHEARAETKKLNSTQRCLSILEELRELHQQGGLSQEDFNNLQKHLISSFSSTTNHTK